MKTLLGVKKLISGGQTGADRAALDFALEHEIEIGGYVPFGRMAEDGRISDKYLNLIEASSADPAVRTEKNVIAADATLIVSRGKLAGGSLLTRQLAEIQKKPFLHIDLSAVSTDDAAEMLTAWITATKPAVLNIAGPRESEDAHIYDAVKNVLDNIILSE